MEGGDFMTIMPHWKICPRCHRRYDWNPDVGVFRCPYCMEKNMKRMKRLKRLISGDDEKKSNS